MEERDPTARELMMGIAHRLDVATMVLLDILNELRGFGLSATVDPADRPLPRANPNPQPPPRQEGRWMEDGDTTYYREPLPGKHCLMVTIDNATQSIASMKMELPGGQQVDISPGELHEAFGIDLGENKAISPFLHHQASHPTDRSLNPDAEVDDNHADE